MVAYATLSPTECPFDRLELVYRRVVSNLMPPMKEEDLVKPWEKGIEPLLRHWYHKVRGQGGRGRGQGTAKSEVRSQKSELGTEGGPGSEDGDQGLEVGGQGVMNLRDYVSSLKGTESFELPECRESRVQRAGRRG